MILLNPIQSFLWNQKTFDGDTSIRVDLVIKYAKEKGIDPQEK